MNIKERAVTNAAHLSFFMVNYNLLPPLQQLSIPTLLIHGDYDHIPLECAEHIAQAIPGARLALLKDCGHFSHLECPQEVRNEITAFLQNPSGLLKS